MKGLSANREPPKSMKEARPLPSSRSIYRVHLLIIKNSTNSSANSLPPSIAFLSRAASHNTTANYSTPTSVSSINKERADWLFSVTGPGLIAAAKKAASPI